jgi:reactive intermediate/imine deaminase
MRFALLLAVLMCGCASSPPRPTSPVIEHLSAPGTPPGLPFSPAVRVGDLIFLSGQIGNVPGTTTLVSGGIEAETRQALDNIKGILEANGSSMNRVFKCTVMMADMKEWPAMNTVYATYFAEKPARSAFGATALALGARVEIECAAVQGR